MSIVRRPVQAHTPTLTRRQSIIIQATDATVLNTDGLDRSGTRALGTITVSSTTVAQAVVIKGRTVPSPRLIQLGSRIVKVTFPDPTSMFPAGLAQTRALGSPTVSPTLNPSGLVHTRALGSPLVGTVVTPAGLTHTRAQGSPTVNPTLNPAGLSRAGERTLGSPTLNGAVAAEPSIVFAGSTDSVVRAIPRREPAKSRQVSLILQSFEGVRLSTDALIHTRALGSPSVSSTLNINPVGLVHTRALGSPVITNPNTFVTPTSLDRTGMQLPPLFGPSRTLGQTRVSLVVFTPAGLVHTRALPAPTVTIFVANPQPAGLVHTRALGSPTLNIRIIMAGLAHTRGVGSIVVSSSIGGGGVTKRRMMGMGL